MARHAIRSSLRLKLSHSGAGLPVSEAGNGSGLALGRHHCGKTKTSYPNLVSAFPTSKLPFPEAQSKPICSWDRPLRPHAPPRLIPRIPLEWIGPLEAQKQVGMQFFGRLFQDEGSQILDFGPRSPIYIHPTHSVSLFCAYENPFNPIGRLSQQGVSGKPESWNKYCPPILRPLRRHSLQALETGGG